MSLPQNVWGRKGRSIIFQLFQKHVFMSISNWRQFHERVLFLSITVQLEIEPINFFRTKGM